VETDEGIQKYNYLSETENAKIAAKFLFDSVPFEDE